MTDAQLWAVAAAFVLLLVLAEVCLPKCRDGGKVAREGGEWRVDE